MKVPWLFSSCLAAIDIGNIKLPSPETLGQQHDLPFFADRIRHSLEVEDRSQYLQATKELLEELSDKGRFLKYQHLAHKEMTDLQNFDDGLELRSNTDDYFKRLMINKCGISDEQFEAIEKYVQENELERTCLHQLKQWNEDLNEGNWYGQRICDSWGEKITPRNMPGVHFLSSIKTTGVQAYLGIVNPGLVDQCKTTIRPPLESNVKSGYDGSYKGQYVDTRRFRRTWLLDAGFGTILETLACANACGEDEECQAACYEGFRFFPAWGNRGKCYPDACSASGKISNQFQ